MEKGEIIRSDMIESHRLNMTQDDKRKRYIRRSRAVLEQHFAGVAGNPSIDQARPRVETGVLNACQPWVTESKVWQKAIEKSGDEAVSRSRKTDPSHACES